MKIKDSEIRREIKQMKTAMSHPKMDINVFIYHHAAVNALEWVIGKPGAVLPSQLSKFVDSMAKNKKAQ